MTQSKSRACMIDLGKKPTVSTGLKGARGWGSGSGGEGVYSVLLRRTRLRRMFHLRLGFWFGLLGWGGDGRSEPRGLGAGGQPAITPRGPAVADEVSGEFSSTSLRSTIRRDGSAYSLPPLGGWGSPKGTAVESAGGTKAPSQPCIEGLVYSRAMRIALTRTRRMNGASSRLVTQAYILLRVDGPSIAWMVGGRVSRGLW